MPEYASVDEIKKKIRDNAMIFNHYIFPLLA